jgi:hypothetical protein
MRLSASEQKKKKTLNIGLGEDRPGTQKSELPMRPVSGFKTCNRDRQYRY